MLLVLSAGLPAHAWAATAATADPTATPCPPEILAVQAAREFPSPAQANTPHPPADGWVPVTLPDAWTTRWPDHEGVVWYRIIWRSACPANPLGQIPSALLATSINMAGEVYLNDTLLWRDATTGPGSRNWNMPRYWVLPPAAMREGQNDLWIRVQGHPINLPGLGLVRLGDQQELLALYEKVRGSQRTAFLVNLIGSAFMACLFAGIWLLYRKQALYGWFALLNLAWVGFIHNVLATDPWPFDSAVQVARANAIAFMLFCLCYALFIFRLQGRALARHVELGLGALTLAATLAVLLAPDAEAATAIKYGNRTHLMVFSLACVLPLLRAWRQRSPSDALYALLGLGFIAVAFHDMRTYHARTPDPILLTPYVNLITMAIIAMVLGSRIAASMRRTERFNAELSETVDKACLDLETELGKKHELALSNTQLQERLRFIHDLHDGFGSALGRAIIQAERDQAAGARHISTLKSLRDDLRNVMDNGKTRNAALPGTPSEWMAPTRRRYAMLFDELEMSSHWDCPAQWPMPPTLALCLELTRVMEEALSNVLKHSGATEVHVALAGDAQGGLTLDIRDNGRGFDAANASQDGTGIGLQSMQARLARLGGSLQITSQPGHSRILARVAA